MRHIARHTKTNAKHPGLQWHGCTLTHRSEELTQHTCCSIVTDTTPNFNFDFASVLQSNVSCNKVLEVLLNSLPSLMRPARTKHLESFIIERVIFTSCNKPRARLIPSELNVFSPQQVSAQDLDWTFLGIRMHKGHEATLRSQRGKDTLTQPKRLGERVRRFTVELHTRRKPVSSPALHTSCRTSF